VNCFFFSFFHLAKLWQFFFNQKVKLFLFLFIFIIAEALAISSAGFLFGRREAIKSQRVEAICTLSLRKLLHFFVLDAEKPLKVTEEKPFALFNAGGAPYLFFFLVARSH
jgi:hypothetical protein